MCSYKAIVVQWLSINDCTSKLVELLLACNQSVSQWPFKLQVGWHAAFSFAPTAGATWSLSNFLHGAPSQCTLYAQQLTGQVQGKLHARLERRTVLPRAPRRGEFVDLITPYSPSEDGAHRSVTWMLVHTATIWRRWARGSITHAGVSNR